MAVDSAPCFACRLSGSALDFQWTTRRRELSHPDTVRHWSSCKLPGTVHFGLGLQTALHISSAGRIVTIVRPPVIDYRHGFQFAVTPERLWERIEQVDQFERWWPWLSECELEGNGLTRGSVLRGVVAPPLPYRMRIRVELGECVRPESIQATVGGDLTGVACLTLRPEVGGTWAEVAWTIEMQQPAMRLASRFGYPLLRWGHERVVEMTVAGFRRRIEP